MSFFLATVSKVVGGKVYIYKTFCTHRIFVTGLFTLFTTFYFGSLSIAQSQQNSKVFQLHAAFETAMNQGNRDPLPEMEKAIIGQLGNSKKLTPKELAIAFTLAGIIKREMFKPADALPYLLKGLQQSTNAFGKTSEETINAKKYLSWCYGDLNDYQLESKYFYEVVDYYKSDPKRYAIEIADQYNTLAISYNSKGDRIAEQHFLNLGRKLMEDFRPGNINKENARSYNLANIYNSLSISYFETSNFYNALAYANKCLLLRNEIMPGSPERAINLMIIGRSMFQTESNVDSALYYLNKSISIFEQPGPGGTSMRGIPPWVKYKNYKSDILMQAGKYNEAINEARSVIAFYPKGQLANPLLPMPVLGTYGMLSRAYTKAGDFSKALQVCEEALVRIAPGSVPLIQNVVFRAQYATALANNNQWQKANEVFTSVISETGTSVKQLENTSSGLPVSIPHEYLIVYSQAADFFVRKGFETGKNNDVVSGINMLRNIAQSLESRKAWFFEAGIDEGIGAQDLEVYDDLLNALYLAKQIISDNERIAHAFAAIEVPKASLLKSKLSEDRQMLLVLPEEINRKRLNLKMKLYGALATVRQYNNTSGKDSLLKWKEEYMEFIRGIRKSYFRDADKQSNTATVSEPLLSEHTGTIINYFLSDRYLFAVTFENGIKKFTRKEIPVNFFDELELVKQKCLTRNVWNDTVVVRRASQIAKQWYKWLLSDINPHGELVIIPHRQLSAISFEMLDANTNGEEPRYVIQNRPVRYALSASLMRAPLQVSRTRKAALFGGFASSNFTINRESTTSSEILSDKTRGSIDQTLEGTSSEVKQISELLNGDAFFNVRPDDFLQNAGKYKVLHIATHALADQGPHHESNLIFETDSVGKNIVRDVEIASLQLDAEMAVLSACNTGVGKINNSEGMMNLGRSFFISGCPSVVMSLWTVNDASTAKIMSAFYRYLKQGELKSEALQHAKLEYLTTETNPAKKHPYYWAGFIVVGDNASLQLTTANSLKLVAIAGAVILIIAGVTVYFRKRSSSVAA